MKKCAALLAIAMILIISAPGFAVKLKNVQITVSLDNEGKGSVTESYQLEFETLSEVQSFEKTARENSSSLRAWEADYGFFYPHFEKPLGGIKDSTSISVSEESGNITLKYSPNETFARIEGREQRSDVYAIDYRQLQQFNAGGTIVIPENTTINIVLPSNSEINAAKLPPKASVNGNTVTLTGIQSNSITVEYRVFKPIAPRSDDLVYQISNWYILFPAVLIILGILYLKREEIEEKIESYLVEHSDMSGKQKTDKDFELKMD
ncbi:MAG: hypothetical protein HY544_04095 [Candidatus Diapherotrites archaeon]|uniref:Uncharacterized protein n=1 Tax=Candidatus Iainarchaeum sp. TaxID=3101447 RepID=A0A8T3YNR4_9ARCH|nr:hypothetical protein [Candidatus Diapherotrites archaeon]